MTLDFLANVKKLDAAVLYEYLFAVELEGAEGIISGTTFERLAETLNAAGLSTARSQPFTAAVVRLNLQRLEELRVVERARLSGPFFELRVFRYKSARAAAEEPRANLKTNFEVHYENENENENGAGSGEAPSSLKNELINKQINNPPEQKKTISALAAETATDSEFFCRFRRLLVRDLYEPGLHAELIDRAVLAFAAHLVTSKEVERAVRRAKEERAVYDATKGLRGVPALWRSFALSVKAWFDEAGFAWTPTALRREPAPEPRKVEAEEGAFL